MNTPITLALLAHTTRQEALADFALDHRAALSRFHLLAPAGTGALLQKRTRLPVELLPATPPDAGGPLHRLAHEHEIQAVIFFRDPHDADPADFGFADLLQLCDYQEILLATNPATAEALLYFLQSSPQRGVVAARAWGRVPPAPDPVTSPRPLISTDLQRF